ncbi:MAG: NAD(P)/FAD-dependent oxidoreductase [Sandaracinaceae bacterium]|nr:NAD(P)/FAD-dependent oxidoreductase [Sandaracinaceae bacterium]
MSAPRVQIAGAGPAGLTCAIVLARAGVGVDVHERRERLGHRFCGDYHGVENWSADEDVAEALARWGIERRFLFEPVRSVLLSNGRRVATVASERPVFYLVARGDGPGSLERGLAEQAQALGARLHLGSAVAPERADVVATGPDPKHRFCVETGIRFRTSSPDVAVGLVHPRAAHRGYAYLLVHEGWGCLCVVCFGGFDRAKEQLSIAQAILTRQLGLDVRDAAPLGGYGSFRLHPELGAPRRPRVGEAAGLQDFVWGFGIHKAMASGALAAESLLASSDYVAAAGATLAPQQPLGVVNRFLWEATAYVGFGAYLRAIERSSRPLGPLRSAHAPRLSHRLLLPLARYALSGRYASLFDRAAPSR